MPKTFQNRQLQPGEKIKETYEQINQNSAEINADLVELYGKDASTNERISNIISQSGTSDTEVVDARSSSANGVYQTLKDRLDADYLETFAILDEKADLNDIDLKRDKSVLITMADLSNEVKLGMTGGSVAVVGDNSIISTNIIDKQVIPRKTSFFKTGKNIFDINAVKNDYQLSSTGTEVYNVLYCISDYIPCKLNDVIGISFNNGISISSNRIVLYDSDYTKLATLSTFASESAINIENAAYFRISLTKAVATNKMQIEYGEVTSYEAFYNIFSDNIKFDQARLDNLQELNTLDKSSIVAAINEINSKSKSLSGKNIVCFGDSITAFGNYPEIISIKTGATVHNVGFGGTRLGRHPTTGYDAFSMYRLADAIATGDWSLQDANVNIDVSYASVLERLKGIDFSIIDIIIINHGTNDFSGGVTLGDLSSVEDGYRYYGALKYIIRKLQNAFPKIQIIFVSPAFRARFSAEDLMPDTNSNIYPRPTGEYLIQFVDAMIAVANKFNLPCFDFYRNCGVNEYNYSQFLGDGLHPNEYGYNHWGNKFASFILANV